MIFIGIIEDDPSLRMSLIEFIRTKDDLYLSFSCNSIEQWLAGNQNDKEIPKVIFLDIGLPGISGLKAIKIIKRTYPDTILILITGDSSLESILEALSTGANGYLLKPFSLKEFDQQIEIVKTGGAVLSPNIADKLIKSLNKNIHSDNNYKSHFTARQNDVLEYLLMGLSYKEISILLGLSVTTVNDHIKKIYSKMGVNSKSELANKIFNQRLNQQPLNDNE